MIIRTIIVIGVVLVLGIYLYLTRDKREFQRDYDIRLPLLCTVELRRSPYKEYDRVFWGKTRHRRLRKDGRKDRRYSYNIRWMYPTTIHMQYYRVKIWRIEQAREVVAALDPFLRLQLSEVVFKGKPEGNIYKHIGEYKIEFVRYIAKLLMFYGWNVGYGKGDCRDLLTFHDGKAWTVHCFWSYDKFKMEDFRRLPHPGSSRYWIIVSLAGFEERAKQAIFKSGGRCMDEKCVRESFLYEEVRFM